MNENVILLAEYAGEIRNMIRHENDLTNNRLTWLLTFQSLLFGAASLTNDGSKAPITIIISIVGILTAISFSYSLWLSMQARKYLGGLWQEKLVSNQEVMDLIPPVAGGNPNVIHLSWLNPWILLPWLLVVAWIILIIVPSTPIN